MSKSKLQLGTSLLAVVALWVGVYLIWSSVTASLGIPYLVAGIPYSIFKRGCVDTLLYVATTLWLLTVMEKQNIISVRGLDIAKWWKYGAIAVLVCAMVAYLVGVFSYWLWPGSWVGDVWGRLVCQILIERENVSGASFVWPSIAFYFLVK